MSERELFVVLVGFGILVGISAGIICARREQKMLIALITSGLFAVGLPLLFWFASILIQNLENGSGLIIALFSATFWTVVLSLTAPFVTAVPALISAAVCFWTTQRVCCASRQST